MEQTITAAPFFQGQLDGRQRSAGFAGIAGDNTVLTGTLRSSRISTRLPCRSRSVIFNTVMVVAILERLKFGEAVCR